MGGLTYCYILYQLGFISWTCLDGTEIFRIIDFSNLVQPSQKPTELQTSQSQEPLCQSTKCSMSFHQQNVSSLQ